MKKDFLLELGTEELPARRIGELVLALADGFKKELVTANLAYEEIKTYATPRRLALLVIGLVTNQPDQSVELRGPPSNLTVAAEKFAQNCGVSVAQLTVKTEDKGQFLFYSPKTVI